MGIGFFYRTYYIIERFLQWFYTLNNTTMEKVQNLIIGFGKAGKTLAVDLAKAGQSVILVEQSPKMYGGTCINVGCIPSKKLAFLAHEKHAMQKQDAITLGEAVNEKDALIEKLNKANYDKVAKVAKVVTGKASFVDANTVKVALADGEKKPSLPREFSSTQEPKTGHHRLRA